MNELIPIEISVSRGEIGAFKLTEADKRRIEEHLEAAKGMSFYDRFGIELAIITTILKEREDIQHEQVL